LRVFEDYGGISKRMVVQGGLVKLSQKKKKKKREIRGGWSHLLAHKWGGRTTPFLAKGWLRPPHPVWGGRSHPQAFGGCPATPKATKKKKIKIKRNGFVPLGVAGPPPRAWGGFSHPLRPHPGPWGWSGHPQRHKPILFFFFFFLGGF
jgi:hypothetical protein